MVAIPLCRNLSNFWKVANPPVFNDREVGQGVEFQSRRTPGVRTANLAYRLIPGGIPSGT